MLTLSSRFRRSTMAKRADLVYRRTQVGWMFNVSGLDAVELSLASGARFRIGTDRPGEVMVALGMVTTLAAPPPADLQGGGPA